MKFKLLFFFLLFAGAASAQSVVVHKDPRVDLLAKRQSAINVAVRRASAHTAPGYRLLVINTSKREEAIAAKSKILTLYPEMKAYLVYQSPYYKLKAGNFKTRAEAENYRKTLNPQFPKGVFIISETVELKAEKETVEVED